MARNYTYRNLIVWQRAQELALKIIQITQRMPQNWSNAVLIRQIISSATSVGANIAEGHGRYAVGAHRNHLSIARGSAAETDSWLDLLRRGGWITAKEEAPLHIECDEIIAILTSKMIDLDRLQQSSSRVHEAAALYLGDANLDLVLLPFIPDDYAE